MSLSLVVPLPSVKVRRFIARVGLVMWGFGTVGGGGKGDPLPTTTKSLNQVIEVPFGIGQDDALELARDGLVFGLIPEGIVPTSAM